MDQQMLRERAEALCVALREGDIEALAEDLSKELRPNMGALVAQLPLPVTEAAVERVDTGAFGNIAILHLVGEADEMRLTTRWKERDGRPTIVEASRVAEAEGEVEAEPGAQADESEGGSG